MKKLLTLLLSMCMLLCVGIGLTACGDGDQGNGEPEHSHYYNRTEWSFDETEHWYQCESEGCTQVSDKMEHVFANDCADTCICGYQRTAGHDFSGEWLMNATEHWRECQREDCHEVEQSEHSFSEWENFDEVQHTKECVCGFDLHEVHSWDVGEVTTELSCEQIGVRTYRCTVCDDGIKTEEFGELGHQYSFSIQWIADEAVINFVCEKDPSHQHGDDMVITKTEVGATCTENAKDLLLASYEYDGKTYTDTKTITHADTKIGHSYVLEDWQWTGYSVAEARFVCENDENHEQLLNALVNRNTVEATCDEDGEAVYTATVSFENQTYTDIQKETLAHTGHDYAFDGFEWTDDYSGAKAKLVCRTDGNHTRKENLEVYETTYKPTCVEDGYIVYSVLFRYEEETHQDFKQVTDEGSATGHDFEEWGWSWEDDYSGAKVLLYCNTCRANYYYDGTITSETFPATCIQAGRTEYTATATVQGETYTKTELQTIPASHNVQNGVCIHCGYRESIGLEYQETDDGYEIIGRGTCEDVEIYIPETYQGKAVVAIAVEAFKNQTDITLIKVPSSVKLINKGAFKGCTALEELTIPFVGREIGSSYNYIGYIFGSSGYDQNMDYTPASLRKLIITGGNVGSNALYSCNNVKEIHILDGATVTLGVNSTRKTYGGLRNCTSVERLTLPEGASATQYQSFYLGEYFGGTYTNWVQAPSSLKFLSIRGGQYCNISNFANNYPTVKDLVIGNSLTHASIITEQVVNLFYEGTEAEYNALASKPSNYYGTTNIYYYSAEKPTTEGNFWHWGDDGVTPMPWNVQGAWKFDSMKTTEGSTTTEVKVGDEGITEDYVVLELKTDGTFVRVDKVSGAENAILTGRWNLVGKTIVVTYEDTEETWFINSDGRLNISWSTGSYPNWISHNIYLKKS